MQKLALPYSDKVVLLLPDWHSFMHRAAVKEALGDKICAEKDRVSAWKIGHDFPY